MSETLLALVPTYGFWLLAVCTFCSCLALPIPASIMMMAAGGFAAAGDLSLSASGLAALGGAVAGDQLGYLAGRKGGAGLTARLGSRAAPLAKATELLSRRGGIAVFLSRWLVSALGPYINLAAGAARMRWLDFTLPAVAGELVWCSIYLGLGWGFARDIEDIGEALGNLAFAASAGVVAVLLGRALLRRGRD